jgi:hypothetical protein
MSAEEPTVAGSLCAVVSVVLGWTSLFALPGSGVLVLMSLIFGSLRVW